MRRALWGLCQWLHQDHRGFQGRSPTVDALTARTDLTPDAYADLRDGMGRAGATIVGGCCEVGPAHIAEIATPPARGWAYYYLKECADG